MMRIILIVAIVIALIAIAIYAFGSSNSTPRPNSDCPSSFTIHPYGQIIQNAVAITYSANGGKYYKQDSAGIAGYSGGLAPVEIAQDVFMAACKQYKSGGGQ